MKSAIKKKCSIRKHACGQQKLSSFATLKTIYHRHDGGVPGRHKRSVEFSKINNIRHIETRHEMLPSEIYSAWYSQSDINYIKEKCRFISLIHRSCLIDLRPKLITKILLSPDIQKQSHS